MLKRGWKTRWIKALRSGKYKQANFMLCNKQNGRIKGYCCLGVLARVEGAKFTEYEVLIGDSSIKIEGAQYLKVDWCGIAQITQTTLADMNDGGKNFKQIAAWIKKNIKAK